MVKSIYISRHVKAPLLLCTGATVQSVNALLGDLAGFYDTVSIVEALNAIDPATGDCRWLEMDEDGFWCVANSHLAKAPKPTPRAHVPRDEEDPAF